MLADLLQRADIWRGRQAASRALRSTLSTGFEALDARLPGGGWPIGALTEILYPWEGVGELQATLPALARLSQGERWVAWIDPPLIPYAPALAAHGVNLERLLWVRAREPREGLWALEQSLRSGACAAVLGWPVRCDDRTLRRLQLAAEHGQALAFLYRPLETAPDTSPAALRLAVRHTQTGLELKILKCRGQWARGAVAVIEDRSHPHLPPVLYGPERNSQGEK